VENNPNSSTEQSPIPSVNKHDKKDLARRILASVVKEMNKPISISMRTASLNGDVSRDERLEMVDALPLCVC
jgi:hypothetical protein